MSLFKAWSEDNLNKKFVVAENFAELVSKGKRFCFPWRVGDLTLFEVLTGGAFDRLNWQHKTQSVKSFCLSMTVLRAVQRQIRTLLAYTVYRNVKCSSLNVLP